MTDGAARRTGNAGKVVVITGAGRGIGRSYAKHLAAAGARVVVNDRDADADRVRDEIVATGGEATAVVGSVSDWEFAGELIETAIRAYGTVDAVVCNAGVYHIAPIPEETPAQIATSVESNLVGTLNVGLRAIRRMLAFGSGVVVTTTSSSADGLAGAATYSATKGAIVSLTYSWAAELAGTGVRVNCVRPRALTRMSTVRGAPRPGAHDPDEIAPVVEYLLDHRSAHLNGVVLGFDGARLEIIGKGHPTVLREADDWSVEAIANAVDGASTDGLIDGGVRP